MTVVRSLRSVISKGIPCLALCTLLSALCVFAEAQAQQLKEIHRIGFFSTQSLSSISTRVDAFRQGLRELGYSEGQNISIEMRSADGQFDRLSDLVAQLVRLKVDLIVVGGLRRSR
jgi:putative ABC transport system substrate-binding protein